MSRAARIATLISSYWIGAGLVGFAILKMESLPVTYWELSIFVFVAWLAEALYIRQSSSVVISSSHVVKFAALLVLGPLGAAVTAALASVRPEIIRDPSYFAPRILFNVAQHFIAFGLAGIAYIKLGGPVSLLAGSDFPHVVFPLMIATGVVFLVNNASVALAVAVNEGSSLLKYVAWLVEGAELANHMALTLLAICLAQMFWLVHFLGILLLAIPLIVSRQVYAVYLHHKGAYVDALTALVGALEAKDRYTRGHSERVAAFAASTGKAMGLSGRQVDDLRMAGLLHDIGKLAVRGTILRKPSGLSDDEFAAVKKHPAVGTEIVQHITLLHGSLGGIRYHHERIDGTGYHEMPGESIPLSAKILCVVDAYDSMTSRRSYRDAMPKENAFKELREQSGKQFDANIVEEFIGLMTG